MSSAEELRRRLQLERQTAELERQTAATSQELAATNRDIGELRRRLSRDDGDTTQLLAGAAGAAVRCLPAHAPGTALCRTFYRPLRARSWKLTSAVVVHRSRSPSWRAARTR